MTDKQIINGVDVSGCDFLGVKLAKNRMCACSMIDFCNEEPNCYYKQLKRKEQECERLKKQLTILDDEDVVVEITVKQFEEYKKLKQTLTEIKEIAENNKHSVLCFTAFEGDAIEVDNKPMTTILQKISEVENG